MSLSGIKTTFHPVNFLNLPQVRTSIHSNLEDYLLGFPKLPGSAIGFLTPLLQFTQLYYISLHPKTMFLSPKHVFFLENPYKFRKKNSGTSHHTVDGRNPAPVDMENLPLFTGFYLSQVVQEFFHQHYFTSSWGLFPFPPCRVFCKRHIQARPSRSTPRSTPQRLSQRASSNLGRS